MEKARLIRYKGTILLLAGAAFMIILLASGCQASRDDSDVIAYISVREDSPYIRTFKELRLGTLFDFHMKLPRSDQTWITMWVEGYSAGEQLEPAQLVSLSYEKSPDKQNEGPMGIAIVNELDNKRSLLLYAPGAATNLQEIEHKFSDLGAMAWGSALGNKELRLKSGEIKTLAFYTQTQSSSIATIDPANEEQMKQIIESGDTLLLMKIKVDKIE